MESEKLMNAFMKESGVKKIGSIIPTASNEEAIINAYKTNFMNQSIKEVLDSYK